MNDHFLGFEYDFSKRLIPALLVHCDNGSRIVLMVIGPRASNWFNSVDFPMPMLPSSAIVNSFGPFKNSLMWVSDCGV